MLRKIIEKISRVIYRDPRYDRFQRSAWVIHLPMRWRLKVAAMSWPWQMQEAHWSTAEGKKNGWGRVGLMGRFGAGWDWKLGISIGGTTLLIDLLFGSVSISLVKPEPVALGN